MVDTAKQMKNNSSQEVNKRSLKYLPYIAYLVVASIVLLIANQFWGVEGDWLGKVTLTLGGTCLVAALLLYEHKVQLSLPLIALGEILSYVAATMNKEIEGTLTVECIISIVGIFSALYIWIRKCKKEKIAITVANYVKAEIKPYKIGKTTAIILVCLMVISATTIISTNGSTEFNITLFNALFIIMPTFIMMITVFPVRIAMEFRLIYYVMWVYIIAIANSIMFVSIESVLEPLVMLITVIIVEIRKFIKKS